MALWLGLRVCTHSAVCFLAFSLSLYSAVSRDNIILLFFSLFFFPLRLLWFTIPLCPLPSDLSKWQFCVFGCNISPVSFSFFFSRLRGLPAPWGSGSRSYLSGIGSSRLGSLKGGPTASGWQASSTRRASWQPWDRYTRHHLLIRYGGEEARWHAEGRPGTQPHSTAHMHARTHAHNSGQTRANEFQFVLMLEGGDAVWRLNPVWSRPDFLSLLLLL